MENDITHLTLGGGEDGITTWAAIYRVGPLCRNITSLNVELLNINGTALMRTSRIVGFDRFYTFGHC